MLIPPPITNKATIATQTQLMLPQRRLRVAQAADFIEAIGAVTPVTYGDVPRAAAALSEKRTVSVYSAGPSPRRFPHERQKRISRGIGAPHCAQTIEPSLKFGCGCMTVSKDDF